MSDEERWFPEISFLKYITGILIVVGVLFMAILAFTIFSAHPYRLGITFAIAGFCIVAFLYWSWNR